MNFGVYGAHELPRVNRLIDSSAEAKNRFWKKVDNDVAGLSNACGCYVFAAQNRPWYIGLAEKQSFAKECLTDNKLKHYNNTQNQYERSAPYLYFIAKLTPTGRFSKPSQNGHADIQTLEKILIGLAISRNPDVINIRGTKLLRKMNVPGILNTRQGQSAAYAVQEIRSLFGI